MFLRLFWDIDRQHNENNITFTITVSSDSLFDVL